MSRRQTTSNKERRQFWQMVIETWQDSGMSVSNLPHVFKYLAEVLPLTHSVRLARAVCTSQYQATLLLDLAYAAVFITLLGFLAVRRLRKRLIR